MLNMAIMAENEDLKTDKDNKAAILSRCLKAVHSARNRIRAIREEKEARKRAEDNESKTSKRMGRIKEKLEAEVKTKDDFMDFFNNRRILEFKVSKQLS